MSRDKTGRTFEQAVGRIQQTLDPESLVTYREKIVNRLGISREFDVVIRGSFAGQPMLGVIECKDWTDRVGTPEVDAFIRKSQDVNANLRMMVSQKGFTEPALVQAKDAGVGVFSLLPDDANETGFSLGVLWYGRSYIWMRLFTHSFVGKTPQFSFDGKEILYKDVPVVNIFEKELSTTYLQTSDTAPVNLQADFHPYITVTIRGETFRISKIHVRAQRVITNKRRFMQMTGDALYNWESKTANIPKTGFISIHGFDLNMTDWEEFEGDIPETGPYQFVIERHWGCLDLEKEKLPEIPRGRMTFKRM
jgi:hypothetical protein